MNRPDRYLAVSIDPGAKNGFVVFDLFERKYIRHEEYKVWEVFFQLDLIADIVKFILIEDARKNWNPKGGREGQDNGRAQGAGWVKTLGAQYEEFVKLYKFELYDGTEDQEFYYKLIKPNKVYSKKDVDHVFNHTGVISKSQNTRDALMMFRYYGF